MLQAAALYATVSIAGAGQSVRDLNSVGSAVNRAQGVMSGLTKNAGQIAGGVATVGQGLLRVGEYAAVAAVGLAGASAKVATDFQQQMELIKTQAGATQAEVVARSRDVQALVHEVGTSPTELARGLYHIESVGVRGAAAMDILKASALGAKVGLADMEATSNALTAVWFSGVKGATSMTDAMAILDGIVGVGNMRLQDLTDSFKSGILGTAATFGVDIKSIGAALATLTDAGVPAQIAATRLNMTLSHMAAPTAKALGVLQTLGVSQFQLANDLRQPDGLDVALKDLGKHLQAVGEMSASGVLTPKGAADLTSIFGGSRFGATAMQLLTNVMGTQDRVAQKYDLISTRAASFSENVQKTMETAGFSFAQLKSDVIESALAFGEGFLPAIARAATRLDKFIFGHLGDFRQAGKDLGDAIDKIDWTKVEQGAIRIVDLVKEFLGVIKQIPAEVLVAGGAFLGLNKVSGGLLGKGAGEIAGGVAGVGTTIAGALVRQIGGMFRGAGGVAGMVGGALGSVGAAPVFVTNWPLGGFGGGGGGLPPVAPVAGGGLLAGLGAFVSAVAAPVLAVAAVGTTALIQQQQTDNQAAALAIQTAAFAKTASDAQLADSIDGVRKQLAAQGDGPLSNPYGVKSDIANMLNTLITEQNQRTFGGPSINPQGGVGTGQYGPSTSMQGFFPGKAADDMVGALGANTAALASSTSAHKFTPSLTPKQIHDVIAADRKARGIKDTGPSTSIQPRLTFLGGNAAGSKDVAVGEALALGFERSVTPLFQQTSLIPKAIKALEADQHQLLAHGDTKSAHLIAAEIVRLKAELARRTADAATKTAAAAAAAGRKTSDGIRSETEVLRGKNFSPKVNVTSTPVTITLNTKAIGSALISYTTHHAGTGGA